MIIDRPVFGEVNQGTLFNCAVADRYQGKRAWGLAITARCDIANDKYPVLNYLPVVSLNDWMHCDGFEILLERAIKSLNGKFEGTLKQGGVAPSVLSAVPRMEVVSSFFEGDDASSSQKKLAGKAREQAEILDRLDNLDIDFPLDRDWFLNTYEKEAAALVKELILNKVPSFYFLPSVTDENEGEGFVILLRESAFLPRRIAKKVSEGVDKPSSSSSEIRFYLSFLFDDFSMPVGQIPSPHIEHILQTFSLMFGRIGLDNYPDDFVSDICGRKFAKEDTT